MNECHPISDEQSELLALGVLAPDEAAFVHLHINSCQECTRKLAEAHCRIAFMALAAPPEPPTVSVRDRLLRQIRAEGGSHRLTSSATKPNVTSAFRIPSLAPLSAAVILSVMFWASNYRLRCEFEALQAAKAQEAVHLEQSREIVDLLSSPATVSINLGSIAPNAVGNGRVLYNGAKGALLYTGLLPQLSADKCYELWLLPQNGNPISAGVFNSQSSGEACVVLPKIPAGIHAKAFAVTIESAGGAPRPTGPKLQIGAVF